MGFLGENSQRVVVGVVKFNYSEETDVTVGAISLNETPNLSFLTRML